MLLRSVPPDLIFLMVPYLVYLLFFDSIHFFYPKMYKSSQIYKAFQQKYKILQNFDSQWESKLNCSASLVPSMLSGVVLAGPQARPCTSTHGRGRSDLRHPGREATAGLQDGDYRWRGGSHTHPGNQGKMWLPW